jgi:hypothetical protein
MEVTDMRQYKLNLEKAKASELHDILNWFLNLHPFSERLVETAPEHLKKFFEEKKNDEKN